jgi:hypothetical protein
VKQQGSLGFTLQKEDDSVLGHYVRALVREPATTDGRIRPGDKIIAVNDVPITSFTHEQAVIFLRQAADTVKLRLYRDGGQTPICAMSPNDPEYKIYAGNSNTLKKKQALRPEAINLLTDLAHKKNAPQSSNSSNSSFRSSPNGTTSSPRRLRKAAPHSKCSGSTGESSSHSYSDNANFSDSTLQSSTSISTNQAFMMSSESGSGAVTPFSDSSLDTPTVISSSTKSKNPPNSLKYYDPHELSDIAPDDETEGYYDDDEIDAVDGLVRPNRPNFLNLAGPSGSTPTVPRKPAFQFSIATANAYELNNLDGVLDAPVNYKLSCSDAADAPDGVITDNFTSLPCETLLLACKTENDLRNSADDSDSCLYVRSFHKQNPMYQSAQVQISHKHDDSNSSGENKNLLKWKGVTLSADEDEKLTEKTENCESSQESDAEISARSSQRISLPNAEKDLNLDDLQIDSNEYGVSMTFFK